MLTQVVLFLAGLALLLGGGQALVRGAAAIATGFGVPPIAVGMTVVAFGTSAPELVVAVVGAITGAEGVAFGNLAGANIVNIGLILGTSAILVPLVVHPTIVTREIPMLLLAMCAALVMSLDGVLSGAPNRLDRGDGLVLCLLFGVFLYYTIMALRRTRDDAFVEDAAAYGTRLGAHAMLGPAFLVLVGLGGLAVGGNLLVDAAVDIAKRLGMAPAVIGLTIVSIGTTMPEFATSLLAVRKGETDLAVGNVVGSNIFNILWVLGIAAAISPIDVPPQGPAVLLVATGLTVLLLVLVYTHQRRVIRAEGGLLLLVFLAYMAWVTSSAL